MLKLAAPRPGVTLPNNLLRRYHTGRVALSNASQTTAQGGSWRAAPAGKA